MKPVVAKVAEQTVQKVLDVFLAPAAAIYVASIQGFTSMMAAQQASLQDDTAGAPDKLQRLRSCGWGRSENSMLQVGGVWAAEEEMRELTALDALKPILGGRTAGSMAHATTRSVAQLLEKAIYDVQVCGPASSAGAAVATAVALIQHCLPHTCGACASQSGPMRSAVPPKRRSLTHSPPHRPPHRPPHSHRDALYPHLSSLSALHCGRVCRAAQSWGKRVRFLPTDRGGARR